MNNNIFCLTINKLKKLIGNIVHETIEDFLEDLKALSSKDYLNSIKESREDYKAGHVKDFNEEFALK
ncbi:MAG: hypothetical protein A2W11_08035 [Ignavibacteria bacterium RBG_16_35_7]|nr:MAG: hypothetical protein A2W11_08035 [Ignavibacteria bacterium RBG_16_35_7]